MLAYALVQAAQIGEGTGLIWAAIITQIGSIVVAAGGWLAASQAAHSVKPNGSGTVAEMLERVLHRLERLERHVGLPEEDTPRVE